MSAGVDPLMYFSFSLSLSRIVCIGSCSILGLWQFRSCAVQYGAGSAIRSLRCSIFRKSHSGKLFFWLVERLKQTLFSVACGCCSQPPHVKFVICCDSICRLRAGRGGGLFREGQAPTLPGGVRLVFRVFWDLCTFTVYIQKSVVVFPCSFFALP